MRFKSLLREYILATYYGADKHLARLLPQAVRVLRARLKYGVGPIPFSLFWFATVPEVRWPEYFIKKGDADRVFDVVNPHAMHRLARNKVLFYEHCRRANLPTIPILCRVGDTPDPLGGLVPLAEDGGKLETLLASGPSQLFAKSIDGSFGENAFLITRCDTGFQFADRTGSAVDLFAYIRQQCGAGTGFIIEPRLQPHAEMMPLASASGLPTVRVVTAMCNAEAEVLYACLKIPVGTNITDNFAHGTSGNLLAGIHLDSGRLTPCYGSRCRTWPVMMQVDRHPDSGYRVSGSRLPFWREVVGLALTGQRSLPDFRTIGWDLAVTAKGVVLVEANSKYSMDILQVAHQRGLKSELGARLHMVIR